MAIQNNPNLYTAGAVQFDSNPSVNLYAQLMAKRQAKNEALNQFFDKELRDLSPSGVREVHKPGITKDINDAKAYWYENKDKILKGGQERIAFDKMIQNSSYNIEKAKARDKFLLELGKARVEGKYDPDDDDLKVLDKVSRSIYDKESYKEDGVSDYGWSDLSPAVPEYDPNKGFDAAIKGMKGGRLYDEKNGRRDPVTGLEWIGFTDKFSPEQAKSAGMNIATEFNSNKSAKKYWEKQYNSTTPEELADLNAVFKKHYSQKPIKLPNGKVIDMDNIDSPEEFAMAAAAKRAEEFIQEKGEVSKSDWQAKTQAAVNKIYIQDSLIRGRQKGGLDGEGDFDIVRYYGNGAEKVVVKEKVGGGMFPKYEEKDEYRVLADNIPDYHQKYLGDIKPKIDPVTGKKYYKVLPNNDWEGSKGTIKRDVVEKAFREASTSLSKRTGLPDGGNPQPKPATKTPKYKGLDKNGNPIFE